MSKRRTSPVWKLSKEEFIDIIDSSDTMAEVLRKIGLKSIGGNHKTVKKRAQEDNVELAPLMSRSKKFIAENNKDLWSRKKKQLVEIMVENSSYSYGHLKERVIREGVLEEICAKCGIGPEWNGESLTLVLDHINGVSNDHRLENLRLLCPNCNSQADTFCGRHPDAKMKCRAKSKC